MRQRRTFQNQAASVPAARRFATAALSGLSVDLLEAVELMVSELATNCVRHTDGQFQITVSRSRNEVRVEAMDETRGEPRLQTPGPADPHGRGLRIVEALSTDWGVDLTPHRGKVVWFTVPVGAAASQR